MILVLQNCLAAVVGRYIRSKPSEEMFDIQQFLIVSEFAKFLLSLLLECISTKGQLVKSLQTNGIEKPLATCRMIIPACLYLVSNSLVYVAFSCLTVPVFQVLFQGKLVITAVVSVFMLKKKFTPQQWLCLFAVSLGAAIVVVDERGESSAPKENVDLIAGCISVSLSCFLSSLASVYFEKIVKGAADEDHSTSLWMRNIQLSFFSILFASLKFASGAQRTTSFLHGFDRWVWLQVFLFGTGGLLVAAVIKHADNVIKSLAIALSMIVSSLLNSLLFGSHVTDQFTIGAAVTVAGVYTYSSTHGRHIGIIWMLVAGVACITIRSPLNGVALPNMAESAPIAHNASNASFVP